MFFSLAMVLVLAGLASAAPTVLGTSQKGSLLIFPKVIVQSSDSAPLADTIITIGNDYFEKVWVKCYWMDKDYVVGNFLFALTPNQPMYFMASTGTGDSNSAVAAPFAGVGALMCWAVSANGEEQISFNHLYGSAVLTSSDSLVTYNAYSFKARPAFKETVGTAGEIKFDGTSHYDACPQYLVTNFFPNLTGVPGLALVPGKLDLRQDRTPTCTRAKFDIWNENETKFTGAYQCLKCYYEDYLESIGLDRTGFGGDKFTSATLKTEVARFRVQAVPSATCKFGYAKGSFPACPAGTGVATPLLGVLLYANEYDDTPGITGIVPHSGATLFGAGADSTGYLYWDAKSAQPESSTK